MKNIFVLATFAIAILAFSPLFAAFNSTTVNGDIIVTDTETGLVWQKTYVSGTWQQALSYCESLTYAGYSDWRLPDKNELASLVNYEKYNPASNFPGTPTRIFWSSTSSFRDQAWSVNFVYGIVDINYKSYDHISVRCVR